MNKWKRWNEKYEFDPTKLIDTSTLEVENISEETAPRDLHRLFSKYGVVLSVAIEAGYESEFLKERDTESDTVIGPDKVIGRVTMLKDDAAIADKNLHARRWRGQKLRLTLKRDNWSPLQNFEE